VADARLHLRHIPGVDVLLAATCFAELVARHGRDPVLDAVRGDLDASRQAILAGELEDPQPHLAPEACAARVELALARRTAPHYPRVLNATGVVLHTGLGRAPLSQAAQQALLATTGYALVEVDADSGRRGHRDAGVSELLAEISGAEAATVVNNNAGATLIALAALAAGRPVIVSRGQLVEIGGSFRIPDVMAQSGAKLVEVGTTNRTHLRDYERALDEHPDTALLLRVHSSNFQVVGFTKEVGLEELVSLGRARGVPVMDDLGSGCFVDLSPFGLPSEPLVQDSLRQGAAVVTFSGDKLLGGPQAGLIAGQRPAVERIRNHPLYRALRPDKLCLAALEATLGLYRDPELARSQLPVLGMIAQPLDRLRARADALADRLRSCDRLDVRVEDSASKIGGGSYAVEELPTVVVSLAAADRTAAALARALRLATPGLFVRIKDERLLLDPRTLLEPHEDEEAARVVLAVLG
jgi:L-seryl-tRNA(Ser) seleniumtransferase